ncbi:aldolase [Methanohalobium sp.]|uniref:aldolase n=1 Tax=Methanohalobium sp. TaxID=2837493 RepID=UPI0025D1F631|nr:aldolase [Methanohalobium sp.]
MWQEISRIGRKLVEHGLVESHFGNISVRVGNKMIITRSGCPLDEVTEGNVVEIDVDKPCSMDIIGSSESIVHREIYKNTSALAIIHAHCPYAVTQSLLNDKKSLVPVDSEGKYFLDEIPVVEGDIGTEKLAYNTADALGKYKGTIVYSHGTFAAGKILDDAYITTTQIEHSCKIKYLYDMAKK